MLYAFGILDFCINKVCPCGEVMLTLNTLGILLAGLIYHCVATVYGLIILLNGHESECVELEMFKEITGIIYAIWLLAIILFIIFILYRNRLRAKIALN